jgi:hypothetical protein
MMMLGRVLAAWLAAVPALTACSEPDRVADRAVDYNRLLEEAENRALLLNVLRAANDRPLYFTSFSAPRGSMSVSLDANAAATIGLDGDNSTSLGGLVSPNASIVNSPSFDLAVLDTQSFARGLLTPVDNDVLDVFYQQDREMRRLLDLFVNRIDVVLSRPGAEGPAVFYRARFWNDPLFHAAELADPVVRDRGRAEFRCVRSVLARSGLELRQGAPLSPIRLSVPVTQLGDAEAIANALKAGLQSRPAAGEPASVELLRLGGDAEFVFPDEPPPAVSTARPSACEMAERPDTGLFVRSTEGVVRYVGRRLCARYGPPVCETPQPAAEPPDDEILTLAPAGNGRALAAVEVDGHRFAVAADDRASARTMARLKQLIALHNRAEEAPTTAAVTVVGTGGTVQAG